MSAVVMTLEQWKEASPSSIFKDLSLEGSIVLNVDLGSSSLQVYVADQPDQHENAQFWMPRDPNLCKISRCVKKEVDENTFTRLRSASMAWTQCAHYEERHRLDIVWQSGMKEGKGVKWVSSVEGLTVGYVSKMMWFDHSHCKEPPKLEQFQTHRFCSAHIPLNDFQPCTNMTSRIGMLTWANAIDWRD